MKVLITGASGQLWLDCVDAFASDEVVALGRDHLDVGDEAAVWDAVGSHAPDVVVNAAAWTDVDGCENDPARAHRVHALGPWWVARACSAVGARLVTISTDYVFSGDRLAGDRGWSEVDPVSARNVYGRSKAAGEQLVRETLAEHHIVRTAWLAGARGDNFVAGMLRLARDWGQVSVVDDQFGSPTFTFDLAPALRQLAVARRYGTIHLAGAGWCSRHELAVAAFELAGLDVEVAAVPSTSFSRPAARPGWSVLDGTHAAALGVGPLPHWRESLARLVGELSAGG